jgi:hypothetical protein
MKTQKRFCNSHRAQDFQPRHAGARFGAEGAHLPRVTSGFDSVAIAARRARIIRHHAQDNCFAIFADRVAQIPRCGVSSFIAIIMWAALRTITRREIAEPDSFGGETLTRFRIDDLRNGRRGQRRRCHQLGRRSARTFEMSVTGRDLAGDIRDNALGVSEFGPEHCHARHRDLFHYIKFVFFVHHMFYLGV